jgi:hypothetical protein
MGFDAAAVLVGEAASGPEFPRVGALLAPLRGGEGIGPEPQPVSVSMVRANVVRAEATGRR